MFVSDSLNFEFENNILKLRNLTCSAEKVLTKKIDALYY